MRTLKIYWRTLRLWSFIEISKSTKNFNKSLLIFFDPDYLEFNYITKETNLHQLLSNYYLSLSLFCYKDSVFVELLALLLLVLLAFYTSNRLTMNFYSRGTSFLITILSSKSFFNEERYSKLSMWISKNLISFRTLMLGNLFLTISSKKHRMILEIFMIYVKW